MRVRPEEVAGRSLLAVFAHPDDESLACGGLLAWCAALGVRVSLVCMTRGEHGEAGRAGRTGEGGGLGEVRTREVQAAARVLGIADTCVLDHEDGMLPWIDPEHLERDISAAVRRLGPDVVITFGEDGLYWHPDHVAVHERTTAVVAGLEGDAPALYYVSMPPGRMRALVDHVKKGISGAEGQGFSPGHAPRGIFGVADPDAFGTLVAPPTLVVDAGVFASRKLAAIRCHRTQLAGSALELVEDRDAARLLGEEHYRRAEAGARGEPFIERFRRP